MHKGAEGRLWDFLCPPALEGGSPKSSCPPQGCSTPMDQPIQPQVNLSVGLGFGDL